MLILDKKNFHKSKSKFLLTELMWVHNVTSLDKKHIHTTKRQFIKVSGY